MRQMIKMQGSEIRVKSSKFHISIAGMQYAYLLNVKIPTPEVAVTSVYTSELQERGMQMRQHLERACTFLCHFHNLFSGTDLC